MPHPAFYLTKTLLTRTSLKLSHQPLRPIIHPSIKHFSTSQAAMTIKTYFDVSWQGPVLDHSGKPTKEIKGNVNCPTFANIPNTLDCNIVDGLPVSIFSLTLS